MNIRLVDYVGFMNIRLLSHATVVNLQEYDIGVIDFFLSFGDLCSLR